jgi:serine/threonine-protein kinase
VPNEDIALAIETPVVPAIGHPTRPRNRPVRWFAGGAVAVLLLIVAAQLVRPPANRIARAPTNLTVVTPFRVAGADPALAYLREGLVDLLVAKLIDDNESPAADAGAVMTAWRRAGFSDRNDVPQDDALRITRQLGGVRLLTGSVVGQPSNLVVNATLLGSDGTLRAQASAGGAVDSLTSILDRLVARLLAKEAGEWERLENRTSTSVVALRAYLDGQAAYRRGGYRDAIRHFRVALERDPSFAMAGLALANAAERVGASDDRARGLSAAWASRRELALRDSVYLMALAGAHYPAESSPREQLASWERAAAVIPDRADSWHELGERLFYDGRLLGISDWATRAAAAFRRSAELDGDFASPLQYLLQLAAADADTVGVRLAASAYLRIDSIGDLAPFVRWRAAIARGDSSSLRVLRRRFASYPAAALRAILLSSQFNGVSLGDAERVLSILTSRAARGSERADLLLANHALALNAGQLESASDITETLAQDDAALAFRLRVLDHLYAGADRARAERAVERLIYLHAAAIGPVTVSEGDRALLPDQSDNVCVVRQQQAWTAAAEQLQHLSTAGAASSATRRDERELCAALIDAVVAVRTQADDADQNIARFDSLRSSAPRADDMHEYASLALARLYRMRGDGLRALSAIRERPHMRPWPRYLAAHLLEEGQLAAAAGDNSGASRAYRHYLALRRSPVGAARFEADSVRAVLDRLVRSPATN